MSLKNKIKGNPKVKAFAHWHLFPTYDFRPRWWVRNILFYFTSKRGKGSIIRSSVRKDILPYNQFSLGDYAVIEDFTTINNAVGDVEIGEKTLIGLGNTIIGPAKIGKNILFAQNITVSGLNHNYEDIHISIRDQGVNMSLITVEDDCWIGTNSVLTAGIRVGKHAIVAAGSVVTKDVPAFSIVAGSPAKVIKKFNHDSGKWERVINNK